MEFSKKLKTYNDPELDIRLFSVEDVILASIKPTTDPDDNDVSDPFDNW